MCVCYRNNVTYSNYFLNFILKAEVRLAQIAGELFIIACFSGRPDVKLKILEPTAEKAMENFVVEFARKCILGAVLNFSLGELLYPDEESTARVCV